MWSSYPLGRILLAFVPGLLLHSYSPHLALQFAAGLGMCVAAIYCIFRHDRLARRKVHVLGICWLFFVLGSARGEGAQYSSWTPTPLELKSGPWMGEIRSPITTSDKWFRCELSCLNAPTHSSWQVYLPRDEEACPAPFDTLLFHGTPQPIRNDGNPFEFDKVGYYANKQIDHIVFARSWELSPRGSGETSPTLVKKFRSLVWAGLDEFHSPHLRILMYAMMTGDKQQLPKAMRAQFVQSGIIHILAVSGMHIGLLAAIPMWFLKRRKQKTFFRVAVVIASIALIWLYAFLVGGSPSVVRSSIMFSLFLIADHQRKRSHSVNLLCASAFCILMIWPEDLFSLSFQLSHLAVFGIVVGVRKLSSWYLPTSRFCRPVVQMAYVSISAQLATSPIILFHFNSFPTYFLLANLVIVPLLICGVYLTLIAFLTTYIPLVSDLSWWLLRSLLKWSLWGVERIIQLPYSTLHVSQFDWPHVLAVYGILGQLLIWKKHAWKVTLTRVMLVVLVLMVVGMVPEKEMVVFAGTRSPCVAMRQHDEIWLIGDSSGIYEGVYGGYLQHHTAGVPTWSDWYSNSISEDKNFRKEGQFLLWGAYLIEVREKGERWEIIVDEAPRNNSEMTRDTMIWDLDRSGAFSLKELILPSGSSPLHAHRLPIRIVHR